MTRMTPLVVLLIACGVDPSTLGQGDGKPSGTTDTTGKPTDTPTSNSSSSTYAETEINYDGDLDGYLTEENATYLLQDIDDGFVDEATVPSEVLDRISKGEFDCDDFDSAVYQELICYEDGDGDGVTVGGAVPFCVGDEPPAGFTEVQSQTEDCDDTDPDTWQLIPAYVDADGDGVTVGAQVLVCSGNELPEGYATVQSAVDDVDDTDPTVWQELPGYVDADGDGATVGGQTLVPSGNELPQGYAAVQTAEDDCDDTDPARSPEFVEVCNNGIDDDCDDQTDCIPTGDIDAIANANVILTGEVAGDEAGYSVAGGTDVDGNGTTDALVGAHKNDLAAGAVYLVLNPGPGQQDVGAVAQAKLLGEVAGDKFGFDVAYAGDVDGDGVEDFLVGARNNDNGGTNAGAGYLVSGSVVGTNNVANVAIATLIGENSLDLSGYSVSSAGNNSVLVGAPGYEMNGFQNRGRAYLVDGPFSGNMGLGNARLILTGETDSDAAGQVVAGNGDVDGDGVLDILVSSSNNPSVSEGTSDGCEDVGTPVRMCAGAVFLVNGLASGNMSLAAADAKIQGEATGDRLGYWAATIDGDMDTDGYSDLLVGAPFADSGGDNSGTVYLVHGPISGIGDVSTADAVFEGEEAEDFAGVSVAFAGDVNGDGNEDILIGASDGEDDLSQPGAAYLLYGPVVGAIDLASADLILRGAGHTLLGNAVSPAGDMSGDGVDDLWVAGYKSDLSATDAGAVFGFNGGGL